MRPEIVEFKRICETLLEGAQQRDRTLTEKECKVVAHYVQELQKRVLPSQDDGQPLVMPLGAIGPIID
jgi:hypothetical protein